MTATIVLFFSTGCNNPLVENNDSKIDDNYRPGNPGSKAPLKTINSSLSVNSAAASKAKGSQVSAKIFVTQRQTKLSGSTISAKISLNSGRVSQ